MNLVDELTKLVELRRTSALTEDEFSQAKAKLLSAPADSAETATLTAQLAEIRYQNELTCIDREWQIERETYMTANRYGRLHVPTVGTGLATAIIGGGFWALWTLIAFSITRAQAGRRSVLAREAVLPAVRSRVYGRFDRVRHLPDGQGEGVQSRLCRIPTRAVRRSTRATYADGGGFPSRRLWYNYITYPIARRSLSGDEPCP